MSAARRLHFAAEHFFFKWENATCDRGTRVGYMTPPILIAMGDIRAQKDLSVVHSGVVYVVEDFLATRY